MDKKLLKMTPCNHCSQCQDIQRQFYISEGKSLSLAVENFRLKKALKSVAETSQENHEAVSLAYSQNVSSLRNSALFNQASSLET